MELSRFWSKVNKTESCWNWTAGTNNIGYGVFWYNGKNNYAHRIVIGLATGDLRQALHKCDNKKCVRPSHLYIGSHLENMDDAKSRNRMAKFNRHGRSKLSEMDCYLIKLQREDGFKGRELAKWWGVDNTIIYRAANRFDALIEELNK